MDALLKAKLNMENNNSHLLNRHELTDDHLLMTVADIFGAGVETTTTVLKWAVLYLLHYPEVSIPLLLPKFLKRDHDSELCVPGTED